MTRQESFKRRVRERMAKTGERYMAARRALLAQASQRRGRAWASPPEVVDERVRAATGRGWDAWCDAIEAWPGHAEGHKAVAAHLAAEHGLDPWWSQTVTVGWERITGRRLPHQKADGSFTAGRSRTVGADPELLRALLLDARAHADLFPGVEVELRSKPTAKTLRFALGPGIAQLRLDPAPSGKLKVSVQHEGLASAELVEEWKHYWGEWLAALDEAGDAPG